MRKDVKDTKELKVAEKEELGEQGLVERRNSRNKQ